MTFFDQRHQQVTNQHNAVQINFGGAQNPQEWLAGLEQLKGEVVKAREAGTLSEETGTDAEYQLTKAAQQAQKTSPNKKTLLEHLHTARSLLEGVAAASGLVTTLAGAIEAAQKLFS